MSELSSGMVIRLRNGKTCRVKKELGRGGQGIVYLVEYDNNDYALKWYTSPFIINSDSFYDNLDNNVKAGSPASNFIWPLAITERQYDSFGYVMSLKPQGFEDMSQFLLNHVQFSSPKAQINACLQITQAFQRLHIRGLSYQDMNDGNFFINPTTGDILIGDNDNVAPDGTNTGVQGKAGYMAPEIIEGDSKPNRYTDYYSLAVCLFILLYMHRPFVGAHYQKCPCDNNPEMAKKLLGYDSVFVMDPTDSSNRPVRGIHDNVIKRWQIYPALLNDAFCRTFRKDAILDPTKRLMDSQWHNILLQIQSYFVICPTCGRHTFIDPSQPQKSCVYCHKPIVAYRSLKVGRFIIPLVEKQVIYECQVTDTKDETVKTSEVITKNGSLGLLNYSSFPWTVLLTNGRVKLVNPGADMPIRPGLKIKFGNKGETGEIV